MILRVAACSMGKSYALMLRANRNSATCCSGAEPILYAFDILSDEHAPLG